ncbi:DUF3307 domain-containing protein [Halomonas halmophila]|uniref:DUF3307 domain-containing protein n=1 Tax=Halomonas halmophila TaxID=252 RepID=A0A4Y4F0I7_9GAMM|nr:DUF3307 domain-containing protein [Halomonas halmophila]GED22947.1 hypothetical protein HHA01_19240 [Halomonas halmophila]
MTTAPLLGLLLAHLLGDFLLQPKHWVESRQQDGIRSTALYLHAGLHGLLMLPVLGLAGAGVGFAILAALVVAITHWLIDLGKAQLAADKLRWFLLDQALHVLVLVAVWAVWLDDSAPLQAAAAWLTRPETLGLLLTYLIVTRPLSLAIALALRPWSQDVSDQGTLVAAGARIGMLERLLVLTLVLQHELIAVGFLLTAKSVLRYGDLRERKERKLTEYVLLGTLLSVSLTLVIGLLARSLIWGG